MSQVIQLSKSQFETLLERLNRLEKTVTKLLEKAGEPPYGSAEWWEWSDNKALREVEKGEYYELKSKEDIKDFFKHIDDEEYVYNSFHHKSKKTAAKTR